MRLFGALATGFADQTSDLGVLVDTEQGPTLLRMVGAAPGPGRGPRDRGSTWPPTRSSACPRESMGKPRTESARSDACMGPRPSAGSILRACPRVAASPSCRSTGPSRGNTVGPAWPSALTTPPRRRQLTCIRDSFIRWATRGCGPQSPSTVTPSAPRKGQEVDSEGRARVMMILDQTATVEYVTKDTRRRPGVARGFARPSITVERWSIVRVTCF